MFERLDARDFEGVFRLMTESFPADEYRAREEQRALLDKPCYRLYGLRGENRISAFAAVWTLPDALFIEHLAVDPALRNAGLGGRLLDEVTNITQTPAVLEVEPPRTDIAQRRIGFYQRHGFHLNDYDYVQPALRAQDTPVPLLLMTAGRAIDRSEFERVRRNIHTLAYALEEPIA